MRPLQAERSQFNVRTGYAIHDLDKAHISKLSVVLHQFVYMKVGLKVERMWDTFYNKVPIDKEHHRHVE